jgi:hypothetical protein
LDYNLNSKKNLGEIGYEGASLRLTGSGVNISTISNVLGGHAFFNRRSGSYIVGLIVPPNFRSTTSTSRNVIIGPSATGINFGIAPTYTISGSVFEDTNGNKIKDNGELNYTKTAINVTSNSGNVSKPPGAGTYTVTNVFAGTYLISFVPPDGYSISTPKPPQFSVTVGPGCDIDPNDSNGKTGASCSGPNIINLNFPIRKDGTWMQTYGFDVLFGNGYTNIIPANPAYPPYAAVVDTR